MKHLYLTSFALFIFLLSKATIKPISGNREICIGSTSVLSDSEVGGTWSSSDTLVAAINSTGVVTGISQGSAIITYKVGDTIATTSVYIDHPLKNIREVYLCLGCSKVLIDSGGIGALSLANWSILSIDWEGPISAQITGHAHGTTTILQSNACGFNMINILVDIPDPKVSVPNISVSNNSEITIYPNPAIEILTIKAANKINRLVIYSILGQTMYDGEYNSEEVKLNVSDFITGVYFIKINGSEVRQFMKE